MPSDAHADRHTDPRSDVLIFDLDETLLADAASTEEALIATIKGADLHPREGTLDPHALASDLLRHAERLWDAGPAREYARAIGISATEGLWGAFTGEALELRRLADWTPSYHRDVWAAALREHGIADDALASQLAARFREERLTRQLLFPDVLPELDGLRTRYRLALLTNGAPDIQRAKIEGSGLAPYFAVIVVSGELGIGKPDPRIFAHTLGQLGVAASATVMIGDHLVNDIRGAQAAGMRAIWLDRRDDALRRRVQRLTYRVSPDATISSLDELPAVLERG